MRKRGDNLQSVVNHLIHAESIRIKMDGYADSFIT